MSKKIWLASILAAVTVFTAGGLALAKTNTPTDAESALYAYLPHDTDIAQEIEAKYELYTDELEAPVKIGDVCGKVTLYYKGEEIASCNLVTKFPAERSSALAFRASLLSTKMMVAVSVFAILCAVFGTLRFIALKNISKKGDSE